MSGAAFTVFTNDGGNPLSKHLWLDGDGRLVKSTAAQMSAGCIKTEWVEDTDSFADFLINGGHGPNCAIAYGVSANAEGFVASQKAITEGRARKGAIARTAENFAFRKGKPAIAFFDIDPLPDQEHWTAFDYDRVLSGALPWWAETRRFYIPSSSSEIYSGETLVSGKRAYHCHLMVDDGAAIKAIGDAVFIALVEAGFGKIVVSKSGSRLLRTVVDRAVWQAERLDFALGAQLGDGLRQARAITPMGEVPILATAGKGRDDFEEWRANSPIVRALMEGSQEQGAVAEKAWIEERVADAIKKGATPKEARRSYVRATRHGELPSGLVLITADGAAVTVGDLLADPQRYHHATFRDPLEPDYGGGAATAIAYLVGQKTGPIINSLAHGGRYYRLIDDRRAAGPAERVDMGHPDDEPDSAREDEAGEADEPVEGGSFVPDEYDRPCFLVSDKWTMDGARKIKPGVWFFGIKHSGEDVLLTEQWVCSPLYVDAVLRSPEGDNYGRLLRFKPTAGGWTTWATRMEGLGGTVEEVRKALLSQGVTIDPLSHRLLNQYLANTHPTKKAFCVSQSGWYRPRVFVLPTRVIGGSPGEVIFQSPEGIERERETHGSLKGWQEKIAAMAPGNPLLMLAISAAFAGTLLGPCHAEGGLIHFLGDSSTGKTTLLDAACSVWTPSFRKSWRATSNGLEGVAARHNDNFLALDEISECEPRDVDAIVYMMSNGAGKARADRHGLARKSAKWKCFILSSGEKSLETILGSIGRKANAGHGVRMLNVPVKRKHGAWDKLPDGVTGEAFSDNLKAAAKQHYGHAGLAFLTALVGSDGDLPEWLRIVKATPEFACEGAEGQVKRAAARFALIALAGELATSFGITGWEEKDAIKAAGIGFKIWQDGRSSKDTNVNDESQKIVEQVQDFINRHGSSRFSLADCGAEYGHVINRAGWYIDEKNERFWLLTSDGFREACKDFELGRAIEALQNCGALAKPEAGGQPTRLEWLGKATAGVIRNDRRKVRIYRISNSKLFDFSPEKAPEEPEDASADIFA